MAGNTIAKASLLLSADGGQLNSGLDNARSNIDRFGKDVNKGGLSSVLDRGVAALGRFGGAALAVGGAALGVNALVGSFTSAVDKITQTAKQARDLGVDLKGFASVGTAAKIAGVDAESFGKAVLGLRENLEQADGPAQLLFGQLGLQVENLRKLPIDEAVAKIAGSLNSIADPAERARLGLAVFRDGFVGLQPLLAKGEDGIRTLSSSFASIDSSGADKVKKVQEAFARLSASSDNLKTTLVVWVTPLVEGVATALGSLGGLRSALSDNAAVSALGTGLRTVLQGVGVVLAGWWDSWRKGVGTIVEVGGTIVRWGGTVVDIVANVASLLTDELMPAWESVLSVWSSATDTVSGWLSDLSGLWTGLRDTVVDVASGMADALLTGLGSALDAFGINAKAVFDGVSDAIGWIVGKIKWLGEAIKKVWDKLTIRTNAGDAVRDFGAGVEDIGAKFGDGWGDSIAAVNGYFDTVKSKNNQVSQEIKNLNPIDTIKAKTLQGINDLEKEIRKSISTIGFTGPESRIFELQQAGADPRQLQTVKQLADQAKQVDAAWSTIQLPPFDLWERQLAGLDQMLESGRISWEQYAGGIANAGKALMSAAGLGEIKTVSAQLRGSSAAVSSIIRAELQDRVQSDPAAELRRAMIEAKEIQKQQLNVAKEMLQVLRQDEIEEVDWL